MRNPIISFSSTKYLVPQNEFHFKVKIISDSFSEHFLPIGVRSRNGTAKAGKDYIALES